MPDLEALFCHVDDFFADGLNRAGSNGCWGRVAAPFPLRSLSLSEIDHDDLIAFHPIGVS